MKTLKVILPVLFFCVCINASYAQETKQSKPETTGNAQAEVKEPQPTRAERRAARKQFRKSGRRVGNPIMKPNAPNAATKDRKRSPARPHNAEKNLRQSHHF